MRWVDIKNELVTSYHYTMSSMSSSSYLPQPQLYSYCGNCADYGFPCLNCAEYELKGKMGPGFMENGRRMLLLETPDRIRNRMVKCAERMQLEYDIEVEDSIIE